jgi:hypothetical protein
MAGRIVFRIYPAFKDKTQSILLKHSVRTAK